LIAKRLQTSFDALYRHMPLSLLSFVDDKRSECSRLAETATGSRHERVLDAARATARAFIIRSAV
jgi:hypothetical protein